MYTLTLTVKFCLCWYFAFQSTIVESCRDDTICSWVEPVLTGVARLFNYGLIIKLKHRGDAQADLITLCVDANGTLYVHLLNF